MSAVDEFMGWDESERPDIPPITESADELWDAMSDPTRYQEIIDKYGFKPDEIPMSGDTWRTGGMTMKTVEEEGQLSRDKILRGLQDFQTDFGTGLGTLREQKRKKQSFSGLEGGTGGDFFTSMENQMQNLFKKGKSKISTVMNVDLAQDKARTSRLKDKIKDAYYDEFQTSYQTLLENA